MKPRPQFFLTLAIVIFLAYFIWEARAWRLQARLYPWAIGVPTLLLALVQLVLDFRGGVEKKVEGEAPVDFQFTQHSDPVMVRKRTFNIFAWIIGFFLAVWLLGFSAAIILLVFLYLKVQSHEPWILTLVLTGSAWMLYWGLFVRLLNLPFPDPQILVWLGMT